jgi:hypothetical protein
MSPTTVTSPEPTHSTPSQRPTPSSMRARPSSPVSPVHVASMPCAGHPLDALAPASLAYKNPRRSNEWMHTIPSYLPDTLTSPSSLSFDVASPAGEVLDAEGTAAFGLRGASGRRYWWRSIAGVFSARRCQALLPLRAPLSPSSSSLRAGELPPRQ